LQDILTRYPWTMLYHVVWISHWSK